jgi:hypothetical protein
VPRLYQEAKSFLKLRSQRNKIVKQKKQQKANDAANPISAEV